ncbi:MAG: TetR/AcrR family transcriptional regulator, partial [Azospirillum sp.]|nr:TetR/AcrR family transcriptional regulator [Azospirillum sp.]
DAARLAKVGALFAQLGKSAAEADARALLFYAFLFGQSLMGGGKRLAAAKRAAAKIVAD